MHPIVALLVAPVVGLVLGASVLGTPTTAFASPTDEPAAQVYVDPGWGYGGYGGYGNWWVGRDGIAYGTDGWYGRGGVTYGDWWPYRSLAYEGWPSQWANYDTYPYAGSNFPYAGALSTREYLRGRAFNPNYVPFSGNVYGPNYGYGVNSPTAGGVGYFQPPSGCYWASVFTC
jgi:hypothetical protein